MLQVHNELSFPSLYNIVKCVAFYDGVKYFVKYTYQMKKLSKFRFQENVYKVIVMIII